MSDLSQLSPPLLWNIFAQICAIPHPSYHEEALAQYIIQWAEEHSIQVERDSVGNILLRKPATPGMERHKPIVLQAHLDMVPQKNSDTEHNFTKDPIQAYVIDGWVKARGTTLGADNGIGMASALAVLVDRNVVHGPLEVLLTMTEEAGMNGAFGLQPGWLQGEILINTDSEKEGEIYMGCAGGIDVTTTLSLHREAVPIDYQIYTLSLKGLKGGHSGCDIHQGLGNANKLMGRFLFAHAAELDLHLLDLHGGTLRNAIPREACATFALPGDQVSKLQSLLATYETLLHNEFSAVDNQPYLQLEATKCGTRMLQAESQQRFFELLNASPNGVINMSDEITGVVETSLNLGIVKMENERVQIIYLIRSQIDSSKDDVVSRLQALGKLADAQVETSGSYPGWKLDTNSPIMQLVLETYQQLFNTTPKIMMIHAGLECALLKKNYPNMDMVSIGPTIIGPHSPDEQVDIVSVDKYWQLLTTLLSAIPEKN